MRKALLIIFLVIAALVLAATPASSSTLDLWIGFTGVQGTSGIRYVNSMIGSNEPDPGVSRMIFTTLTVKDENGATVCSTSVEKYMDVRPAIEPLSFRVKYTFSAPMQRRMTTYTLYARFTIEGNPAETSTTNNAQSFAVEFPAGGTPYCVSLLGN